MKTRILIIFGLLCSFSLAAEPATEASIERLMMLTDVGKMVDAMHEQIAGTVSGLLNHAVKGKVLTAEEQKQFDAERAAIVSRCEAEVTWAKMRAAYTPLYQATFSQEEIDGMIAFYSSPAGKAFMTKMPTMMKLATDIMRQRLVPVMTIAQEATQQAAAKIGHKQ